MKGKCRNDKGKKKITENKMCVCVCVCVCVVGNYLHIFLFSFFFLRFFPSMFVFWCSLLLPGPLITFLITYLLECVRSPG